MKTIFETCEPRSEVLHGELREDIFAARLRDVIDDKADRVYGDPQIFFENTYPTAGLKTLLKDALGRLTGDAAGKNAVIRLETAFGGGKTHNLIALYHVASGKTPASAVAGLLGDVRLPAPNDIQVAGVVGSDLDPTVGIYHPTDGTKTLTLWGELAYQLGGPAAYAQVAESEKFKAAVGTDLFENLIGDQPTLIMIDEIARHLRAAMAVPTATGKSNLADQTVAFLMSLLEFASSKQRCLVVLTLAGESDAFAAETELLRKKLAETLQVSARQERVLTPAAAGEIYAIVTHRLFKKVDYGAAKETYDAYMAYYAALDGKGADLPRRCLRAEYAAEMAAAYPFHPELVMALNRKTATIPNFNQTRGALRLLAWTIRNLWNERPDDVWLIHPYHLDLAQPRIAEDLTSRLDRPKFRQVIEADIASPLIGTSSHAQEVDEPLVREHKPPYAQRLATTIFLHSLTQGIASGVDPADLLLATVQPDGGGAGDEPAVVNKALERLADKAWFLEYDGHRYRFKTEPSINKIIADETVQVGPSKGKAEIEGRIRQIWKKGYFKPVYFPVEAADVDDDADLPKLAIMHFDAVKVKADEAAPPDLVRKIYEYAGTLESFRGYQNNVVFLAADADQAENMVEVARRYLAIGRIVGDAGRMAEFNKEQQDKLRKAKDAAELDVRIAITKAYRYLYYPTADAPKAHAFLRRETLPAQDQGDVEKDQANVVLRVLRALKKALTADDDMLSALYVKAKAWDHNQVSMSTEELRRAFARKIALRILLDVGQLKKTIKNGVEMRAWVYYDSTEEFGYDHDSPPPVWQISDEAILYTPEEAARLNIRIKGKWRPEARGSEPAEEGVTAICPVCGMPEDQCTCGVAVGGGPAQQRPTRFQGQGAAAQAFGQLVDLCAEHKVAHLRRLTITVDALGKQAAADVRGLGLAIPQFGKGRYVVEQDVKAEFGGGTAAESFTLNFRGGWDRYKRFRSLVEAFGSEADELKATMRVAGEFEDGLEVAGAQFAAIRDVLTTLELGRISVEGIPLP
ncbi:MAG: hypothetical protein BWY52_01458 [Chloroflexi bacterium ADurb.Bin325]|nr:MAG: hypothetical protein BWY52_01458 [Chloroflexi bacterium ADurb.Bin325]